MTIKGFWAYISKSKVGTRVDLQYLKGSTVAIDMSTIYYSMRYGVKKDALYLIDPFQQELDDDEIDKEFIKRVICKLGAMINAGIKIIMVFEGKEKDELKTKTLQKRKSDQDKVYDKIETLISMIPDKTKASSNQRDEYRKLLSYYNVAPRASQMKCEEALIKMGIPYCIANGEAERLCSLLNNAGIVDYVLSPDADCFACGAINLLTPDSSNKNSFKLITIKEVLGVLKIPFPRFQELCVMSGTDFNDNIPNIGIAKSLKILKEYGSIDKYRERSGNDVSILNHVEVLKRFKIVDWQELSGVTSLKGDGYDMCEAVLSSINADELIDMVKSFALVE